MADFDTRARTPLTGRQTKRGRDHRGSIGSVPPVIPDTTPPVVTLIEPTDGEVEAATAVIFDVTEESVDGLCEVFVWAEFAADGSAEVIHTGDQFATRYLGLSARTAITGGFRYTVRRSGGWPSNPRIQVKAIDRGGNVST